MESSVICLSPPRMECILWSNLASVVLAGPQAPLPHLFQIYKVPSTSYAKAQEYRNVMPKITRWCALKLSQEHQYLLGISLQSQPARGVPFWQNVEGNGKKDGENRFLLQIGSSPLTLGKQMRALRTLPHPPKNVSENRLPSHIH